jgi:transposase-like protein
VKAVLERALNAELIHHLGYERHDPAGNNSGNSRNGTSSKTVKGDFGELDLEVPRDRTSTFEPQILPKHQTRFTGFDDKIVSLYARGMTTREIEGHLRRPIHFGARIRNGSATSGPRAVGLVARAGRGENTHSGSLYGLCG